LSSTHTPVSDFSRVPLNERSWKPGDPEVMLAASLPRVSGCVHAMARESFAVWTSPVKLEY